ncbi:hypothetical protein XFF6991_30046 [Xanthomonas phaseoli pv. phaseoli]|uniref:Uncharacterized protein n=1 Tax=Xanthomonas campestris pv. phaseoli TaxID=317013 RepID=A0A7Z7IZV7_XANCH|nr:hypothetical protein XFF6991_30046 [Xanthomonas phaseoli pv. phaseoli]
MLHRAFTLSFIVDIPGGKRPKLLKSITYSKPASSLRFIVDNHSRTPPLFPIKSMIYVRITEVCPQVARWCRDVWVLVSSAARYPPLPPAPSMRRSSGPGRACGPTVDSAQRPWSQPTPVAAHQMRRQRGYQTPFFGGLFG